jgi:hypothetical protein
MRRKTFVVLLAMHFEGEQAQSFEKMARAAAGAVDALGSQTDGEFGLLSIQPMRPLRFYLSGFLISFAALMLEIRFQ